MPGILIQIDAENHASAAIQQAQQGVQRLSDQVKEFTQQTSNGAGKSQDFARAIELIARQSIPATGNLGGLTGAISSFNVAAGLAVAAAAALGAAAISAARHIADYQEKMDIAAAATGLTTGQLGGLKVAASESGRSFEQVRPALDYFTRKIGEAADGSKEAQKAFRDLGVSTQIGSQLRSTGDILRDVQFALNGIQDPAVRAQKAFELFGRGAAASLDVLLTPLDQAEEKARKLGIALGPEAERVARQADQAFDALKTSLEGIGNAFGVAAAKALNPFLSTLATVSSKVAEFVNSPQVKLFLVIAQASNKNLAVSGFQLIRLIAQATGNATVTPGANRSSGVIGPLPTDDYLRARQAEIDAAKDATKALQDYKVALEEQIKFQASIPGFGGFGPLQLRPIPADMAEWSKPGGMTPGAQLDDGSLVKALEATKDQLTNLARSLRDTLADAITNAILHAKDLDEALSSIGQALLEEIVHAGVSALLHTLIPIPFQSGGTLAMQGGGTIASFDSLHPIRAQSGLVVSGIRGRDTVPALLGRGETVLDHSLTDDLRSFVREARRTSNAPQSAGPTSVTFHINAIDASNMDAFVRKQLVPKLREVLQTGSHR